MRKEEVGRTSNGWCFTLYLDRINGECVCCGINLGVYPHPNVYREFKYNSAVKMKTLVFHMVDQIGYNR